MIHRVFLCNIWWTTDLTLSGKTKLCSLLSSLTSEVLQRTLNKPAVPGYLSVNSISPWLPSHTLLTSLCHSQAAASFFAFLADFLLSEPSVTLPTVWHFNTWQVQRKTSSALALWAVWFSEISLSTWNCKSRDWQAAQKVLKQKGHWPRGEKKGGTMHSALLQCAPRGVTPGRGEIFTRPLLKYGRYTTFWWCFWLFSPRLLNLFLSSLVFCSTVGNTIGDPASCPLFQL